MHISLWRQFSSNHSDTFRVVGVFATPTEAEQAGAELLALLTSIEVWIQESEGGRGGWGELCQPEIDYAEQHGFKLWLESLYSKDTFRKGAAAAFSVWDRLFFVQSGIETHQRVWAYYTLIPQLGGEIAVDMLESTVALVTLTCLAPDSATAEHLYKTIQTYVQFEEWDEEDSTILWEDSIYFMQGQVQRVGERLTLRLGFHTIGAGLPNLVHYLETQGCREISYEIEEITYSDFKLLCIPPSDTPAPGC